MTTIYRKTSDRSPRLLSVQVSQTPGLYAGPGVYPGPGLYHNMSSLCYFIQKNRQLSCLPGTSILFMFTLKDRTLRRCKMGYKVYYISFLKKYSYKDRLIQLNLSTLRLSGARLLSEVLRYLLIKEMEPSTLKVLCLFTL